MKKILNHTLTHRPPAGKAERLLTMQEVAMRDQCSVKTVRRAIDAGLLEALRIGPSGRAIRITHDAHLLYRMRLRASA